MITNENDFLGLMIKYKNSDDTCPVGKILKNSEMTDLQCLPFFRSLSDKGIITFLDTETYQINPIAYSVYQSPAKKVGKSLFHFTKFTLERLIDFLIGVATGVVATYITQHFLGK